MPTLRGSFSVKQLRPLYIFFYEGEEHIAARLAYFEPGVARISFHPIAPNEPGRRARPLAERVIEDVFRERPLLQFFAVFVLQNGEPLPDPIPPLAIGQGDENDGFVYEMVWINDYLFVIHQTPFERFEQQHQWSRRSAEDMDDDQFQFLQEGEDTDEGENDGLFDEDEEAEEED